MNLEIADLIVAIATLILGTVVSIVIYKLGKGLDFRSRMHRWDELRSATRQLLADDQAPEVVLINAKRYEREYDGGNNTNRHGDLQRRAELFDVRHNGIEFITGVEETWLDSNGKRTRRDTGTRGPNAFLVGFVPFEYVEHINPDGDEYKGAPIFYVRFNGPGKSPYRLFTFHETASTPLRPNGRPYHRHIMELGDLRLGRLRAWLRFWINRPRSYWLNRKIDRMYRDRLQG